MKPLAVVCAVLTDRIIRNCDTVSCTLVRDDRAEENGKKVLEREIEINVAQGVTLSICQHSTEVVCDGELEIWTHFIATIAFSKLSWGERGKVVIFCSGDIETEVKDLYYACLGRLGMEKNLSRKYHFDAIATLYQVVVSPK